MIGIAWYRPDQWSLLRALAADPDRLENSYEEWVAMATKSMHDLAAHGISAVKVDVNVRELVAWCQERHRSVDGSARATFVAEWLRTHQTGILPDQGM
jgi:hypothetical protein